MIYLTFEGSFMKVCEAIVFVVVMYVITYVMKFDRFIFFIFLKDFFWLFNMV